MQRSTTAGFARGQLLLEGSCAGGAGGGAPSGRSSAGTRGQRLQVSFQNENLVAELVEGVQRCPQPEQPGGCDLQMDSNNVGGSGGCVLATVPDLICCIEDASELPCPSPPCSSCRPGFTPHPPLFRCPCSRAAHRH